MLRILSIWTLLIMAAAPVHAHVYRYKDAQGNMLYTDKPPTLPAERLNVQSQKTDLVPVQARQEAELKRLQAYRSLDKANRDLERLDQTKSDFITHRLSRTSHPAHHHDWLH